MIKLRFLEPVALVCSCTALCLAHIQPTGEGEEEPIGEVGVVEVIPIPLEHTLQQEIPLKAVHQSVGRLAPDQLFWQFDCADTAATRMRMQLFSFTSAASWVLVRSDGTQMTAAAVEAAGGHVLHIPAAQGGQGLPGLQSGATASNTVIDISATGITALRVSVAAGTLAAEVPVLFNVVYEGSPFQLGVAANDATVPLSRPGVVTVAAYFNTTPITDALVRIAAVSPTGVTQQATCLDNGVAPDSDAADGLFTGSFTPGEVGTWTIGAMAELRHGGSEVLRSSSTTLDVVECGLTFVRSVAPVAQCLYQSGTFRGVSVKAQVAVPQNGEYTVSARLRIAETGRTIDASVTELLLAGQREVEIVVPWQSIRDAGGEGTLVVARLATLCDQVVLDADVWSPLLASPCQVFAYQFPGPVVEVLEPCESELIDLNQDELADRLDITLPLRVRSPGQYQYTCDLTNNTGRQLMKMTGLVTLPVSARLPLVLQCDGPTISRWGIDGSYRIENFSIWDINTDLVAMDFDSHCYTPPYQASQFSEYVPCADRNGNGICDDDEIWQSGGSNDLNGDGIPDDSEQQDECVLVADLVNTWPPPTAPNGCVNFYDYAAFLNAYGSGLALADVSGRFGRPDGVVDEIDFDAFMAAYLECEGNCDSPTEG